MIINYFISINISSVLENQLFYSANTTFYQTRQYLESYISSYDTLAFTLSRLEDFQHLYKNHKIIENLSVNEMYVLRQNLDKKVNTFIGRFALANYSFFLDNKFSGLTNGNNYFTFDKIENETWFREIKYYFKKNRRSFLLCPPNWINEDNLKIASFVRTIFNNENYKELFGIVRIDIPLASIYDILAKNNSIEGAVTYLMNYKQEIISSAGNSTGIQNLLPYKEVIFSTSVVRRNFSDQHYMVWQSPVGKYHLNLVTLVPVNSMRRISFYLRLIMMISLLILSMLLSIILKSIFFSLASRIQLVIQKMQATNNGILTSIDETPGRDEIGQLITNYNKMVNNLQAYKEYKFYKDIEHKNYELQILWEQINPHFLYNNLDMINWLAKNGQNEKVSLAINALAQFYQAALSGGMKKVPLSKELEHVRAYVNLQNMRFDNILDYKFNMPREYSDILVPRIILQPIVENSIVHGIMEKKSGVGSIVITVKKEDRDLFIIIEDDGIGMTKEVIEKMNKEIIQNTDFRGYGVRNVSKRIKLIYGSDYGLYFDSVYGKGTIVTVKLPIKPDSGF
jgi:two-component system sensor histidine kinase YesM